MVPMEPLEIEERSVEEAVRAACARLGLPAERLDIEVLSRGGSGLFGLLGGRKARIRVTVKPAPLEAAAQRAKEILGEILRHFDLPTVVEASVREEGIHLNIVSGGGSGLLIGKHGKTLSALQTVVAKILQRETGEALRVTVDAEEYRGKRETSLAGLARELAAKAVKTGRPVATAPMAAQDRRIVHMTLKDDDSVRTRSTGEGALRRVVISPVRKGRTGSRAEDAEEA